MIGTLASDRIRGYPWVIDNLASMSGGGSAGGSGRAGPTSRRSGEMLVGDRKAPMETLAGRRDGAHGSDAVRASFPAGFFFGSRGPMTIATAVIPAQSQAGEDAYASAAECMRRHPTISRPRLYRAVTVGIVRVQLLPGLAPRYCLSDVERLTRIR